MLPVASVAVPDPDSVPVTFIVLPASVRLNVLPVLVEELPSEMVLAVPTSVTLLVELDVIDAALVLAVTSPVAELVIARVGAVSVVVPLVVIAPAFKFIKLAVNVALPVPLTIPFILIVFDPALRSKTWLLDMSAPVSATVLLPVK